MIELDQVNRNHSKMPHLGSPMTKLLNRWLNSLVLLLLVTLSLGVSATWCPSSLAALPPGNAITDGKALLRYSLPLDNKPVRQLQASLEDIATQLRANRRWGAISSDLSQASRILSNPDKLLSEIPEGQKSQAAALITELKTGVDLTRQAADAKDKDRVWQERAKLLNLVSQLEGAMVQGFPFEVPSEYSNLPQLKGRATVEMTTSKGDITLVVDGYSAPVTAGNFVDLVQRGFYNGLEFTRAEESYVLQSGDPPGPEQGFIDPKTGKYRAIPFRSLGSGRQSPHLWHYVRGRWSLPRSGGVALLLLRYGGNGSS